MLPNQPELEMRRAMIGGVPLEYADVGEGPAVILIHGGGPGASGLSNYRRNVGPLSSSRRTITLDLPGYGASPARPPGEGMYDTYVDAILGLMDELEIDQADFVGNSLGGGTALSLALRTPERARRLVLMGPAGGFSMSPQPTEGLLRMMTFYDADGPSKKKVERMLDLLVFDRSQLTAELVEERYQACVRPEMIENPPLKGLKPHPKDELWRSVGRLKHETLIIWGREDRVISLDNGFVLARLMPRAELHVFPRTGHWVQWERADQFNELAAQFLDRP
jgi:2-hydroxy-6-oxonona-2,4-dienedioate hydrolase/4,5:9,10-diseco-3-hydroxy-5,9,17-trioxoandrosta-1(10),2-diene-4-oate hydrolase